MNKNVLYRMTSDYCRIRLAPCVPPLNLLQISDYLEDLIDRQTLPPQRSNVPGAYPQNLIGDRELRDVVNALWVAGAEAISINDIRLSATSAIRFAGEVVLVDFQPVTSPYTVRAIGNENALDVAFVGGDAGARLSTLASAGRLEFSVDEAGDLTLPPAAQALPTLAGVSSPNASGSPDGAPSGSGPARSESAGSGSAEPGSAEPGSSGSEATNEGTR